MRSQSLNPVLLPQSILQSGLELFSLELTIDYFIGYISGKLCLNCVDYLALVTKLGYPVILLQEGLELVHRHAIFRRLLEQCAKMGHKCLVILLFRHALVSFQSLVRLCGFVVLLLQLDEKVFWDLDRILLKDLFHFRLRWHLKQ